MQRYLEKRNTKDEETEREHPFIRGHWSKQPFWDRSLSKLNSVRQVELCLLCAWTHVGEAESTIMNLSHWQEIPAQTTGPVTRLLVVFLSSSNLQLTLLHVHTQMIVFISSSLGQQKPLKWSCSVNWSRSVVSESFRLHGQWPTRLRRPWDFAGENTGAGCNFLLLGIFPTQGSNPGLLHCRQTLYHLSHQGTPQKPLEKNLLMTSKLNFRLLSQLPICLFSCLFSTLIWISNKFSKLLIIKAKILLIFFPCSCCQQVVMPSIYMFKETYSNPLLPIC